MKLKIVKDIENLQLEFRLLKGYVESMERDIGMLQDELSSRHYNHQVSLRKKINMIIDYLDLEYDIPEKKEIKLKKKTHKRDVGTGLR